MIRIVEFDRNNPRVSGTLISETFDNKTAEEILSYDELWVITDSEFTIETVCGNKTLRDVLAEYAKNPFFEITYSIYNSDFILTSKTDAFLVKMVLDPNG